MREHGACLDGAAHPLELGIQVRRAEAPGHLREATVLPGGDAPAIWMLERLLTERVPLQHQRVVDPL